MVTFLRNELTTFTYYLKNGSYLERRTMKLTVILSFYLLIASWVEMNASVHYKLRTLSPQGGFYYDGVKAILQD